MRNAERRKLDDYLTEIRCEVFASPGPPFSSLNEAEAWLRAESDRGLEEPGTEERNRNFFIRLNAVEAELRSLGQLVPPGLHFQWGVKRELVSFYSETEAAVARVPATTQSLRRIAEVAQYGADFADVSDANITARLLVGFPLATGRKSERWTTNPIGTRTTTTVKRDPDIRRWEAATGQLKLKLRDRELLRFMWAREDSGAPPPVAPDRRGQDAGLRRYWEDVLDQWNRTHQTTDWHYQHWTSVHRRYTKLVSRLPDLLERPRLVALGD